MWNPSKVQVVKTTPAAEDKPREVVGAAAIAEAEKEVAASNGSLKLITISPWSQLWNPSLWLAAAGQIFFSLSVGFGVIIVYASYMKPKDDVVLSGLTASSANEFCEVALGGLITIPAAVAFLGVAGIAGQAGVGLGFKVLPLVFSKMPAGAFFGGAFFFMLFLPFARDAKLVFEHLNTDVLFLHSGKVKAQQRVGFGVLYVASRSESGSRRCTEKTRFFRPVITDFVKHPLHLSLKAI
jgi:hypothetical protein